jgi:hypothetical protein
MYIGNDLPDMTPADVRTVGFDFINDLASGESLIGSTAFCEIPADLNVGAPVDGSPAAHITNGPTVLGTVIGVQISALIAGIIYRVRIVATTNNNNHPELYAHIRCVALD